MKHMMIDCYCSHSGGMNDCMYIYNLLNELADSQDMVTVAPPVLIPYYYCEDKQDVGISAYVFLNGGHITIHTFPHRKCYFLDIVYDGFFDAQAIYDYLRSAMPFDEQITNFQVADRRVTDHGKMEVTDNDFGPHLVGRIIPNKEINMECIYDALEMLVACADMKPITRASIIKNKRDATYLQGIVLIAQSHISLYYDIAEKVLYFDLFSCAYFDFSSIEKIITDLFGKCESLALVKRGDKYALNTESTELNYIRMCSKWQRNIR